jgi:N-acetylglucosamine kinase-like BadF-type ATPase
MSGWCLGVDGGGTKTTARLVFYHNDGTIARTGVGHAGGSNLVSFATEVVHQNVLQAVEEARCHAQVEGAEVQSAVLAMAGAGNVSKREALQQWAIQAGLARQVAVVPDVWAALAAGVPDGVGIALVVGTGSIAVGRIADGRWLRAGGWGPQLGDEGSGYWIGREAIREVLLALENCEDVRLVDPLVGVVLDRLAASDAAGLIRMVYDATMTPAKIAELAVVVGEMRDVSEAAGRVVGAAIGHLVDLLQRLARRVCDVHGNGGKIPWVVAGGVACNDPRFLRALAEECDVRQLPLSAPIVVDDPSLGAVDMAVRRACWDDPASDVSAFQQDDIDGATNCDEDR